MDNLIINLRLSTLVFYCNECLSDSLLCYQLPSTFFPPDFNRIMVMFVDKINYEGLIFFLSSSTLLLNSSLSTMPSVIFLMPWITVV